MSEPVAPIVNELNAPFWAAAAEGRLALPVCLQTGRFFWPPSALSPFVSSGPTGWREAPDEGTLRSLVIYRRVFQKAFEAQLPYGVGLVELDAGPRLQAHVAAPDGPDAPRAGERVALRFAVAVDGGPRVPTLVRLAGSAAR